MEPVNRSKGVLRLLDNGYECRHGIWWSPDGREMTFSDALLEVGRAEELARGN